VSWAIVGCGYVGERLLAALALAGEEVVATTRNPERAAALGPAARVVDPRDPEALARVIPREAVVIDSVPTDPERGPHMDALLAACANAAVRRIVYLSSTGVYGAQSGAWVDEDTPVAPPTLRGRARAEEENRLFGGAAWTGVEAVALRIAAIYGPGRGVQERLLKGNYRIVDDGGGFISRIHVDDLVQVVLAAGKVRPLPRSVYVVADDEPTTVRAHADGVAALLGLPPPESVPPSSASAVTVEMQTGGRRVRNERMKRELGVSLRYPSWREGLAAILRTRSR
jgi:nucleoside-diphosphate-sugar epimerase